MGSVAQALREHRDEITGYLYVGYAMWDALIDRARRQEEKVSGDCADEQLWTFLAACGYAIAAKEGVGRLTKVITGSNYHVPGNPKVWFEVLPIPPRKEEGETHLDLALGTIAIRQGTESGIELDDVESPWVCFCEMKWYSDVSCGVTHDVHRNQLARVVENALCFQGSDRYADHVHVALVTPAIFRDAPLKSRLYQYKFAGYSTDPGLLAADLDGCILEKNERPDWHYPSDVAQRVARLPLRWLTFDELFEDLPDSPIAAELKDFWAKYGNCQGRP